MSVNNGEKCFELSHFKLCTVDLLLLLMYLTCLYSFGFPGGSVGKVSAYKAGDPGSIPGLGKSPGEGNGNPLQDYCLENPMDRGAW